MSKTVLTPLVNGKESRTSTCSNMLVGKVPGRSIRLSAQQPVVTVNSSDMSVPIDSRSSASAPHSGQKSDAASSTVVQLSTRSKCRLIQSSTVVGSTLRPIHRNTALRSGRHLDINKKAKSWFSSSLSRKNKNCLSLFRLSGYVSLGTLTVPFSQS